MKRAVLVFSVFLLALFLFGCSNISVGEFENLKSMATELENNISDLEKTIESLEKDIDELDSSNLELEEENKTLNEKLSVAEKEINQYKEKEKKAEEDKVIQEDDVEVTLTGKGKLPKDIYNGQYSDLVTLTFSIKNNTDKDIQGVQGIATFNDLFGVKIISMHCDFTGETIPAHSSVVNDNLVFEVNEFISDHTQLYMTDLKDLKFEYEVTCIVFTDGTQKN